MDGNLSLILAFLVSISVVLALVIKFKLHPFLSLFIGCLLMGVCSGLDPMAIIKTSCKGFGEHDSATSASSSCSASPWADPPRIRVHPRNRQHHAAAVRAGKIRAGPEPHRLHHLHPGVLRRGLRHPHRPHPRNGPRRQTGPQHAGHGPRRRPHLHARPRHPHPRPRGRRREHGRGHRLVHRLRRAHRPARLAHRRRAVRQVPRQEVPHFPHGRGARRRPCGAGPRQVRPPQRRARHRHHLPAHHADFLCQHPERLP